MLFLIHIRCHSIPVTIRALLMKYRQPYVGGTKRRQNTFNNNNSDNSDSNSNGHNTPHNHSNSQSTHQPHENHNGGSYHTGIENQEPSNNFNHKSNGNKQLDLSDLNVKETCANGDSSCDETGVLHSSELHVTPKSLIGNGQHGNYFPTVNNRLTPSRRDSYNRSNSSQCQSTGFLITETNNATNNLNHIELETNGSEISPSEQPVKSEEMTIDLNLLKADSVEMPADLNYIKAESTESAESMEVAKIEPQVDNEDDKLQPTTPVQKPNSVKSQDIQTPVITKKNSTKSVASSGVNNGNSSNSNANPTSPSLSSNKKRKAPANELASSSSSSNQTSTPVNTQSSNSLTQPPSAKRKMTASNTPQTQQHSNNDLKRHTSLIEDSTLNSNQSDSIKSNSNVTKSSANSSSTAKKPKMKTSLSSVDLSSSTPKQHLDTNSVKKVDASKQSPAPVALAKNKEASATNNPKSNPSTNKDQKLINSTNKTPTNNTNTAPVKKTVKTSDTNTTPVIKQNQNSSLKSKVNEIFF